MTKLFFIFFCIMTDVAHSQTNYFTSFNGVEIAFTDEGEGKPILLIHGFINSRTSWEYTELKTDLLSRGYRLVIPDLRGNGDSGKPQDEASYADNAEVKDIMLLMSFLKIKKYNAIGYSRGSVVLAELLTKDKRIKKAVLGGMGLDFTNPNWDRRIMFMDAFAGAINEETKGAVDYAKSIQADLRSLHLQQKYQPATSKILLSKIKKEVLVICGDEDTDNGDPLKLKNVFPNGVIKIVPGDHNGTYKTKEFSKAILSFL